MSKLKSGPSEKTPVTLSATSDNPFTSKESENPISVVLKVVSTWYTNPPELIKNKNSSPFSKPLSWPGSSPHAGIVNGNVPSKETLPPHWTPDPEV